MCEEWPLMCEGGLLCVKGVVITCTEQFSVSRENFILPCF